MREMAFPPYYIEIHLRCAWMVCLPVAQVVGFFFVSCLVVGMSPIFVVYLCCGSLGGVCGLSPGCGLVFAVFSSVSD